MFTHNSHKASFLLLLKLLLHVSFFTEMDVHVKCDILSDL